MIKGLEIFKKYFENYKDQYVLIGGAACDIIMDELEQSFRATRDLDMVLIVEALTADFGKAFWNFIRDGKYRNKSRSSGVPQFYRFDKPEMSDFPYMIELFSRKALPVPEEQRLVPIHIDDEISSLSAILLNDVYYQLLLNGRKESNGIMILEPESIILFKARAWLDLTEKREKGFHVDEKDIRKHKNDIIRMATLLSGNASLTIPEEVREDILQFISKYETEPVDLKSLKIHGIRNEEILERLKSVYL